MTVKLAYVISFVDDVEAAVAFYRDALGLTPRLVSPGWVELETGTTTLALHPASERNPSGTTKLSFGVPDVGDLHRRLVQRGVEFTREPALGHDQLIAELVGPGGSGIGLSSPAIADTSTTAVGASSGVHHPRFLQLAQGVKRRIQEITGDELTQLREHGPVVVIDVREQSEWRAGHLAGALHIPRGLLELQIEDAVPDPESRVVVYCAGGNRSALAADSLQKLGYGRVASLTDGFRGWQAAGRPTEHESK